MLTDIKLLNLTLHSLLVYVPSLLMNNWATFVKFSWTTALLMILVLFWDHFALHVNTTLGYVLIKGLTITSFILMGVYSYFSKKVNLWFQDMYGILFYTYSFYGMANLDMTYSFSFIEAFFILALGMRTTTLRFSLVSIYGLIGMIAGHYYAQEPPFVAVGQSYSPHSLIVTSILFLVAMMIHFFVTRQQTLINELNEKFAMVGKQSSFLMHEIKNPLHRVVANAEEGMTEEIMRDIRRDSQKISALVNSVDILIHNPNSLAETFSIFDWKEISENLHLDYNSYLNSMNIKFDFSDLNGNF